MWMRSLATWALSSTISLVAIWSAIDMTRAQGGSPGGIDWYQRTTRTVLSNARKLIEPTLPADERRMAKSITYRVTSSGNSNAVAAIEGNQRVVVIHAGIVMMFDWFAELIAIDRDLGYAGCFKEYTEYLSRIIQENSTAVLNNIALSVAMSPLRYAADSSGTCSGVTFSELAALPGYGENRARAIEASILFLYLHELGHHVLGHTTGKQLGGGAGLAMHRDQEEDADRYAIETALNAGQFLLAAVPFYSFVAAFGGNSIEAEELSDHPLGMRRVLTLYDVTIDYLEEHPDVWRGAEPYENLMDALRSQRAEIEDAVAQIE